MRKFLYRLICLAAALVLLGPAAGAQASKWTFGRRLKRPVAAAPAPDTAKKPTQYEKFLKKKGIKKECGAFTLYTDGKEVWLEIPDSLMGRKLLLSTVLKDSSDPWVEVGQSVSPNKTFVLGRTDSLLILSQPVRLPESADSLERGTLREGVPPTIRYAFPIMMRNGDSTAVVVKAGKLFDASNKDVLEMKAVLYGDTKGLMNGVLRSELSGKGRLVRYGREHLGISRELTFEGDDGTYSNERVSGNGKKTRISGTFVALLSLVPERELALRKVDPRIGVRRQAYRDFSSEKGVKAEYDAARWNLSAGEHIMVYIDTLFPASRREAIRRGVEAWNAGFRQAGLGDVVKAVPYPRDSSFCADNPFICKVIPISNDVDLLRSSTIGSPLTGGTLGATITVPQGYLTQIWRQYAFAISSSDGRFRTLFPSEDALCEILTAAIMRSFGSVLGLADNLAGSAAYSPEQLRDPAFTATHGITASVMDRGAMFNTLARPGDRRAGVPTISNQIGTYDKYAIEWLYKVFPEGTDTEAALKALVDAHEGDAEYLYLPEQGKGMTARDIRARSGDLGNDPLAEYNARVATLKYVAANSAQWLRDARLAESSDRYLFYEWLWLRFNDATQLLSARLGGVVSHPVGSGRPKFTAVDKKLQKEYIKTIFEGWRNLDWMDADRELLHYAGPYASDDAMTYYNMANLTGTRNRLNNIVFAWKEAGSGYSPDEYLCDVETQLLKNVRQGRLEPMEDQGIGTFIMMGLINASPTLKANYNRQAQTQGLKAFEAAEDVYTALPGVPTSDLEEVDILCKRHLEKIRTVLRQGHAKATDSHVRGKIGFLLRVVDTALESEQ